MSEQCVLALQGGGALGAYQAGVYEALAAEGFEPDWLAGISIGSINSALIAGNPRERRVERLREFWETVSSALPDPGLRTHGRWRATLNGASALQALLFGVPGFFTPRMPPATFQPEGTLDALSFYDTTPLRTTIEKLVDFKHLNSGRTRISLGAVNVRTGNFIYFDSAKQRIDARHIMASGALPPGLPPVEIDGEYYWDGGLVSNTPLDYVLEQSVTGHCSVFQVDLFPARGGLPRTIAEVAAREKEIRYSSRTRLITDSGVAWRRVAAAAHRLVAKLPPELLADADARELVARLRRPGASLDLVHLIYRSRPYEGEAKDYEFSRWTMREHWSSGSADVLRTLRHSEWTGRGPADSGIRVFDLLEPGRARQAPEAAGSLTRGLAHETAQ